MPNEIKKSYNPFKMLGSWVGLIIGIISTVAFVIPPFAEYSVGESTAVTTVLLGVLGGLVRLPQLTNPLIFVIWPILPIVLLTPVFTFLYGWGIHSICRKFKIEDVIKGLVVIVILIIAFGVYEYVRSKQVFQAKLNSAGVDIHSSNETVAMNAVMMTADAETDNLVVIDKMLSIATDESLMIDVRLTALESLTGKINKMSSSEKQYLRDKISSFNPTGLDGGGDQERMTGRITML